MSLKSIWRKRAELAADAAFAAKHPMPGADGWVENPFDKLDKAGIADDMFKEVAGLFNAALETPYTGVKPTKVESIVPVLEQITFTRSPKK